MKKFLRKLGLLLILPLAVLELVSQARPEKQRWYGQVASEVRGDETNLFFVGSSRTLAAIDAEALTKALRAGGLPRAHAYNLGGPYSTIAQHFLGLRNLIAVHPEALQGSVWLLETLHGLPEYRAGWADAWANPEHKEMLLSVLRPADLSALWAAPGLELFDKAYLATALFSGLGRSFLDTRSRLLMVGERGVDRWIKRLQPRAPVASDLAADTPVREDEAGVQAARQLAREHAAAARSRPEAAYEDWEKQIVHDWVREVVQAGGRALFLDIPLSSVQGSAYLTPVRREDARRLAERARAWGGGGVVPLAAEYGDEDFPDLIHLRASARPEFSAAVARSLMAALAGKGGE